MGNTEQGTHANPQDATPKYTRQLPEAAAENQRGKGAPHRLTLHGSARQEFTY